MMLMLLEDQVAELVTLVPPCVAVKVSVEPAPVAAMLIVVPELEVTVTVADCPTVTVVVPLAAPDVAVMITPDVVFAMPLINPLLLTLTWVASPLLQLTLLTLPVVPSLKVPVATSCKVWPTCRLGFVGVTVMLLSVGFTKKPRHPASAVINTTVKTASNSEFRLELEIITNPRYPSANGWLVAYCRL